MKNKQSRLYNLNYFSFIQCEDNVPVFLKCGWRDKIIYWIILAFTLCNTIMTFRQMLILSEKFQ